MPHVTRPEIDPRYPVQVTIRATPGLPSFRSPRLFGALRRAIGVLGRKGNVIGDRYHARPLTTPRQMRTSMVYVLLNFRKHLRAPACVDPCSSGPHFSGWQRAPATTKVAPAIVVPATWMARIGWRLGGGPLRVDEHPAVAARPRPT
jgi:hypothetical protein